MPLLKAVGLACGHGSPVLSGVDLSIGPGEVVALLGSNGSGKSTLLNTLAGLIPPLAGTIRIAGDDLASLRTREVSRRLASVPQSEIAPFAFTVRQGVAMGCLARSNGLLDTLEDAVATDAAMERTDLAALSERRLDEISGGERARTLVARALAQNGSLLLMDEPSAHLDAPHAAWLVRLVRDLARDGQGVLIALHDLNIAASMADRVVLLSNGGIAADGPAISVLESPALDAAFRAAFERLWTPSGRLIVTPRID